VAQFTEAIYTNGVFKPKDELALHEAQRVRLTVEPLDDDAAPSERSAALARLVAEIEKVNFFSCEGLPTRDELHDRS
jgi:predicted DNA-binding antitoxin AbrB/MazE fold protein